MGSFEEIRQCFTDIDEETIECLFISTNNLLTDTLLENLLQIQSIPSVITINITRSLTNKVAEKKKHQSKNTINNKSQIQQKQQQQQQQQQFIPIPNKIPVGSTIFLVHDQVVDDDNEIYNDVIEIENKANSNNNKRDDKITIFSPSGICNEFSCCFQVREFGVYEFCLSSSLEDKNSKCRNGKQTFLAESITFKYALGIENCFD
eukprot:Pgem_evm1s8751